jgi:hypothetical protein
MNNVPQLDLSKTFTEDDVANFISQLDDSDYRQVRVTKEGMAYLSSESTMGIGTQVSDKSMLFTLEIWCRGTKHVGTEAAQDQDWVKFLTKSLRNYMKHPEQCEQDK